MTPPAHKISCQGTHDQHSKGSSELHGAHNAPVQRLALVLPRLLCLHECMTGLHPGLRKMRLIMSPKHSNNHQLTTTTIGNHAVILQLSCGRGAEGREGRTSASEL